MKKEIIVSYMRTINLGNYESAKIQAGITQEISPDDTRSYQDLFNELFDECEEFVFNEIENRTK
jgi:hypothetical protein